MVNTVVLAVKRDPLACEQPPDDLERLLEAGYFVVKGDAESAELRFVPTCA
jgi:hypothetical protein